MNEAIGETNCVCRLEYSALFLRSFLTTLVLSDFSGGVKGVVFFLLCGFAMSLGVVGQFFEEQ
jgi:hypothetical protein